MFSQDTHAPETMAVYNDQWPMARMNQLKVVGINGLDVFFTLAAQIATLMKTIDALEAQPIQSVLVIYELCSGNHPSHQCAFSFE